MKKLLFLLIIFSAQMTVCQTVEPEDRGYIVNVGDVAPDFEFTLLSGEKMKLSDLRGKTVMLQFTASWCGVCRREMPFIERDIWQKYKDNQNFALIALDRDEPLETVKKFIKKTGVTYPFVLDNKGKIFELFAVKDAGITRNVIIDKNGVIIYLTRLYNEAEFAEMLSVINEQFF
ncbi:MAG: TlpA family protein disulfide reductase [Prevotellaceae bacterium]|jgi:peroxiredoxin|nr:TlpA family protein disulfide reductase [Prevotellaceae bacterium]